MFQFWPEDRLWSYRLAAALMKLPYGGADFHECVRTARRLHPGDLENWHAEWKKTASHLEVQADQAEARGYFVTARKHYLRAFVYYRQAEYFLGLDDKRKVSTYISAIRCFDQAMRHWPTPVERLKIPFEDTHLAGHLFLPPGSNRARLPCVIFISGLDALPEENFVRGGMEIVDRGLALLIFNGPGQGESLRVQRLYTRPDYEAPVAAVADFLHEHTRVDAERLGVWGISMGGYYAPRAAAFEKRLRACVVWGACYDVLADLYEYYPAARQQLQTITGARDADETKRMLRAFTLEDVIDMIECPLLVTHGEEDHLVPVASAYRTYREARCPKELRIWGVEEGGSEHCMIDNLSEAVPFMADWLADHLI